VRYSIVCANNLTIIRDDLAIVNKIIEKGKRIILA